MESRNRPKVIVIRLEAVVGLETLCFSNSFGQDLFVGSVVLARRIRDSDDSGTLGLGSIDFVSSNDSVRGEGDENERHVEHQQNSIGAVEHEHGRRGRGIYLYLYLSYQRTAWLWCGDLEATSRHVQPVVAGGANFPH